MMSQGADRSTPDSFACDAADGLSNVGAAHHLSHYQHRLALVPLWIAEDLCMSNMSQARSSRAEFDMQLQCLSHVPIPEDLCMSSVSSFTRRPQIHRLHLQCLSECAVMENLDREPPAAE